jgi:hypothetical protein
MISRVSTSAVLVATSSVILLTLGCASSRRVPPDMPSDASWSFAGSVEGTHLRRSGSQQFREPVHGVVEFLPDVIVVNGSHGACTVKRSDVRVRTGRLRMSCDGMVLALSATSGEVTVPVQQESEVRDGCARYSDDTARRYCVEWNYRLEVRTARVTGPVQVFPSDTP